MGVEHREFRKYGYRPIVDDWELSGFVPSDAHIIYLSPYHPS